MEVLGMFKLKDVKANKGATLNKQGESLNYNNGYQVSVKDLEIIPAYRLTKKHLLDMLKNLPVGANLGVWIDNGKAYIDHSVKFNNKRQALAYGKAHNQISIWNWKASEAIAC
jgi:hypothetical protein